MFQHTRLLWLLLDLQLMFGGEKPLGPAPNGEQWHHEGLTRRAAASWHPDAANALAFHTDYVDSYQYNPLWWVDVPNGGGPDRVVLALSTHEHLAKLHFDDLFNNYDIAQMWRRYLSGTVCGLMWVRESALPARTKVSCAHNLIGTGLHAMQDFYSHSNWIDPGVRRTETWFEADQDTRFRSELYTGYYEAAGQYGVHPHGTFEPACSALSGIGVARGALRILCHAASPFTKSSLCRMFRRCNSAVPVEMPVFEGFTLPEGVVYAEPGMNLDSRWQAPLGVQTRGAAMSPPLSSDDAFDTAYELAARTSCQWLSLLEACMNDLGYGAFWQEITTTGVATAGYKTDTDPFERMDLLPYLFLSAGDYPPREAGDTEWYLRVSVETSDVHLANTDAKIVPRVNDIEFPALDYGLRSAGSVVEAFASYDDFARASKTAYVVGPLADPPREIALLNTGPPFVQTVIDIFEKLADAIGDMAKAVGNFLLSLFGYHADLVAQSHVVLNAADLHGLAPGASLPFSIDCNGKSEGHYRVHGAVTATGIAGDLVNGVPTDRFRVKFTELECVKESEWDRGSDSDEPFVVGIVLGHGGRVAIPWRSQLFDDVDDGERRAIGKEFIVDLPPDHGFITLPVVVYESDDETSADREELMNEFALQWQDQLAGSEDSLLDVLGAALGQQWHCARIEAVAFRRAAEAEVFMYAAHEVDRWIKGGEEARFEPVEVWHGRVQVPDESDAVCAVPFRLPERIDLESSENPDSTEGADPYVPSMFDEREG